MSGARALRGPLHQERQWGSGSIEWADDTERRLDDLVQPVRSKVCHKSEVRNDCGMEVIADSSSRFQDDERGINQ